MTPAERLLARIRADGPIPFAEFMREALYGDGGYYARGNVPGGEGADFYTASDLGPFAACLARLARDARLRLGDPEEFTLLELGGGSGDLAARLAESLPDARIVVAEPSPGLAARQRARGLTVVARPADAAPAHLVLANEVLDALPVHRLRGGHHGALREVYVTVEGGAFRDVEGPPTPEGKAASALTAPLEEGEEADLPAGLPAFFAEAAEAVPRGYAVFLDYGEEAPAVRAGRPRGSVRSYRAHRPGGPLDHAPGEADLTASVDFTAAVRAAESAGWTPLGLVKQGTLLTELGILDELEEAQKKGDWTAHLQAKTLFLPGGMGEAFLAMGLARGGAPEALRGFSGRGSNVPRGRIDPDAR
ncbi:MAG TPA: SAM-dependent methyltransferase [Candidatus Thermoplasmatota archaeon]|nr:SAM-dependent methyltransferase [Candidatus Thermoplasmatota archaeon]